MRTKIGTTYLIQFPICLRPWQKECNKCYLGLYKNYVIVYRLNALDMDIDEDSNVVLLPVLTCIVRQITMLSPVQMSMFSWKRKTYFDMLFWLIVSSSVCYKLYMYVFVPMIFFFKICTDSFFHEYNTLYL